MRDTSLGDILPLIRDSLMRDLYTLLGEILPLIPDMPENDDLRAGLNSVRTSVFYAAPEMQGLWWEQTACLLSGIDFSKDWHQAVARTWNPDFKLVSQEMVDDLLNNAVANGYDDFLKSSDEEIAVDLGTFAAELGGIEPTVAIPFIQVWKKKHESFRDKNSGIEG